MQRGSTRGPPLQLRASRASARGRQRTPPHTRPRGRALVVLMWQLPRGPKCSAGRSMRPTHRAGHGRGHSPWPKSPLGGERGPGWVRGPGGLGPPPDTHRRQQLSRAASSGAQPPQRWGSRPASGAWGPGPSRNAGEERGGPDLGRRPGHPVLSKRPQPEPSGTSRFSVKKRQCGSHASWADVAEAAARPLPAAQPGGEGGGWGGADAHAAERRGAALPGPERSFKTSEPKAPDV